MRPVLGRLLRLVSRLVPADRRRAWLREWEAEVAHGGEGSGGASSVMVAVLTALEDAMRLRWQTWAGSGPGLDLRLALRGLLRRPGFTTVVVLTLAVALGANTAVFSVVRGVLLRPLPYEDPSSLALVDLAFRFNGEMRSIAASGPEYLELKKENPAFRDLVAYWRSDVNLGGIDEPLRVGVVTASPGVLDVLGIEPLLGRGFRPEDGRPGAPEVVLLGHGFWQDAFGADPDVLGGDVLVDGRPATVVGVLPPRFEFPGAEARLLRVLTLDPADPGGRSSHGYAMLARLADGLDVEEAQRRTDALVARWERSRPEIHGPGERHPVRVFGLREATVGDQRRPLTLLMGAVGLVLLVACLNVANLFLVRGENRRREVGLRTALGASRGHLARLFLLESLVLVFAGAGLGWLLALGGTRWLLALAGSESVLSARMDGLVFLFMVGLAAVTAVVFGLIPVWAARRRDVAGTLRDGGRSTTSGSRRVRVRRWLVSGQVAMAVLLVAVAGVLGRGMARLTSVDPGFDPGNVVTVDLALNSTPYPSPEDVSGFHREAKRRLEALAEVEVVGSVRTLPLRGIGGWESLRVLGEEPPPDGADWTVQYQVVTPGFLEALEIPLLQGRRLSLDDDVSTRPVALLNRSAARLLFGGGSAVGRQLQLGRFEDNPNPVMTVVGVVDDVMQGGLDAEATAQLYVPRAQAGAVYGGLGSRFSTLVARVNRSPARALPRVRQVLGEIDPDLPLAAVGTMEGEVRRSLADRRFLAVLMGTFSTLGLLLGAVGLYGLLAYVVARRTPEIGIRLALGAEAGRVRTGVVGEALMLAGAGAVAGVGLVLFTEPLFEGLVFGVSPRDPVALVGSPLLLMAVAILASYLPARRASTVDPAEVLRAE